MEKEETKANTSKKEKKPKTKKEIIYTSVSITLIVVAVVILGMASFQIYHKTRYEHFWVNGQSMYPTLNRDAKYKDGTLIGLRGTAQEGTYDIDYGYMDAHQEAIDNLKRFDIIDCHYSTSSNDVVKRIIALPGETFYITMTTAGLETNGNLYVQNANGEYDLIEQPIASEIVHGGLYTTAFKEPYTLADNEYFVMGDNRYGNNSSDSRNTSNKVYKENIHGRIIGLEAYCVITFNKETNKLEPSTVTHYFPWRIL